MGPSSGGIFGAIRNWHPSGAPTPAGDFYKQWYPGTPPTDVDGLPPDVAGLCTRARADRPGRQLDPRQRAAPGAGFARKSEVGGAAGEDAARPVAARWEYQGAPAVFAACAFGDATRDQRWWGDPSQPSWNKGFNWPKLRGNLSDFFDLNQPHLASGGVANYFPGMPQGSDTVPAWLTPGEMVMNTGATNQFLPYLQSMNSGYMSTGGLVPQYFGDGSDGGVSAAQTAGVAARRTGTWGIGWAVAVDCGAALPGGQSQQQQPKPGQVPQGPQATGLGAVTQGAQLGMSSVASPGAGADHPEDSMPSSPGLGIGGGLLGGLEQGALQAGVAAASGASGGPDMGGGAAAGAGAAIAAQAAQIGFQELNRAAGYGAQAAGILTEGVLESLTPSDSSTNWMQTIPGRLLSGIAGARPENPNTAGANPATPVIRAVRRIFGHHARRWAELRRRHPHQRPHDRQRQRPEESGRPLRDLPAGPDADGQRVVPIKRAALGRQRLTLVSEGTSKLYGSLTKTAGSGEPVPG